MDDANDLPEETLPDDSLPDGTLLTQQDPAPVSTVTKAQVEQVFQWVVEGKGQADIEASILEYWPETPVKDLALAVTTRLIEASKFTPDVVRGMAIEATREVYKRALDTADLVVALRAIRQLWEMTATTRL